MANQSTPIPVTATGAVSASPATYRGLSITDTSGSGNTIKLYDNATTNNGTVLYSIALTANQHVDVDISDGVRCAKGIWLQATGSVEGHVRVG